MNHLLIFRSLLLFVLLGLMLPAVAQTRLKSTQPKKPRSAVKRKPTQTGPKKSVILTPRSAPKPVAAVVATSGVSTTTTTTTTQPVSGNVTPSPAPSAKAGSFFGSSSQLGLLLNRISESDTSTRQVSTVGVSGMIYLNGHVLIGLTVNRSIGYYQLQAGLYRNPFQSTISPVISVGAGLKADKLAVGLNLSTVLVKANQPQYVNGQYEIKSRLQPTFGLGVLVSYQLQRQVWVSINADTQLKTGIGAVYFF